MLIEERFAPLFEAIEYGGGLDEGPELLAHYTSSTVLIKILENEEIWFSSPFLMNDYEELIFGVDLGLAILKDRIAIERQMLTDPQRANLLGTIQNIHSEFLSNRAREIFICCFSEHEPDSDDGKLSMWRAYGGNGKGAALVFDARKMYSPEQKSPIQYAKVSYRTRIEREHDIHRLVDVFFGFLRNTTITDQLLSSSAAHIFLALLHLAAISKHKGFEGEAEWRFIYWRDFDPKNLLTKYLSYFDGPNGVEPKFKLKIQPDAGIGIDEFRLEEIVKKIIIGPSAHKQLAEDATRLMVAELGLPTLSSKIVVSSIPLRPQR